MSTSSPRCVCCVSFSSWTSTTSGFRTRGNCIIKRLGTSRNKEFGRDVPPSHKVSVLASFYSPMFGLEVTGWAEEANKTTVHYVINLDTYKAARATFMLVFDKYLYTLIARGIQGLSVIV